MSWLGKVFGGGAQDPAPAREQAAAPANDAQPASAAEIDAVYYRWLAAARAKGASEAREKQILDELTGLSMAPLAGAALVPRLPAIIPQLMRTLLDENMNTAELSRQLGEDVVLVAEVFREANLPCYRPRYHSCDDVDTIEAAVMLLGQNGLRMLLARVALRPIISMQTGRLAKRAAPLLWQQSGKCALAASMLAPGMRTNAFEAYLAGLMANVGLVVAFRLIDQVCPEDEALPQSEEFIAALFGLARILSARITELWAFPDAVSGAIEHAGRPDAPLPSLVLALADRLSKLRMLVDAFKFEPDDPFVVGGLDEGALACFEKLRDEDA